MAPSCRPMMVMTGTSVFFSAWPKLIGAVGQAAGAGELDVVGAQHLQHLRAHQAHDQRHLEQAERDRRQDQRLAGPSRSGSRCVQTADAAPPRRGRRTAASRASPRTGRSAGCRSGRSAARCRSARPSGTASTASDRGGCRCRRPSGCRAASAKTAAANASSSVAGKPLGDQRRDRLLDLVGDAEIELHARSRRSGRTAPASDRRGRARSRSCSRSSSVVSWPTIWLTGSPTKRNSRNASSATVSMTMAASNETADGEGEHVAMAGLGSGDRISGLGTGPRRGAVAAGR